MANPQDPRIKNILIIGNQHLSSTILSALHRSTHSTLTLLTSPRQTPYLPPSVPVSALTHRTTDFTFPSLRATFAGQDLVISTLGGGDFSLQTRIINACVAAGVKRFVAHEFGQDSLNKGVQGRLPPSRERARVMAFLREMQTAGEAEVGETNGEGHDDGEANGCCGECDCGEGHEQGVMVQTTDGFENEFEWVGVAVGCILDQKLISGDLGFDLQWQSATMHGTGKERFAITSLARVGEVVARVVERWEQVKNQYLYSAGCITTADEIVGCLEKAMGKQWTVGHVETEQCVREGEQRIRSGFPDAGMFLIERSVLYDEELGAVKAFEEKDAKSVLDLKAEGLGHLVSHAVHDFEHHGKADCGCG
ncbi:hypothetical protein H2201_007072 [Coniosporium apollinis]|uniref:NAD(P)-binding domain-containing protein n=1 Tax=Coniosporium apollinis TaxID=61459 RepID=A0ABQ9NJZ9_9PEZI|nr:hypothetical protein H2201_007072 [Coniosporium apollinis]